MPALFRRIRGMVVPLRTEGKSFGERRTASRWELLAAPL
jgi:hypothetical protein